MVYHEDPDRQSRSWAGSLLRGFNASVTNNSQAYGFSITVTVTYGVVFAHAPTPTSLELLGFALAAVAALALLNLAVVTAVSARDSEAEPAWARAPPTPSCPRSRAGRRAAPRGAAGPQGP